MQPLLSPPHHLCGVQCPTKIVTEVDLQVLIDAHPLYLKIPDEQWLMRSPPLQFLGVVCFEGDVVVHAACHQTVHLPPAGRLMSASDASYYCGVVRKLEDDVIWVGGDAVVGEQSIEDRAKDTALWGAHAG